MRGSTFPMAARSRKGRRNVKIVDEDDAPPAPSSPRSRSPANWRRVYDNILKMREARDAPVDSMGCERAHDEMAEPKVTKGLFIQSNCSPGLLDVSSSLQAHIVLVTVRLYMLVFFRSSAFSASCR